MTGARFVLAWLLLSAAGVVWPAGVTPSRLANADSEPGQWLGTGRTQDEQRFSPLTRISTNNVAKLSLAWYADMDTNRGQEATPLVIDGRLFVTSAWSKVFAFDARTGKRLWSYDPRVPGEWGVRGCCDVVNRGLAAWGDRLYVGSFDGRLIALDAHSGKVVWEVNTIDRSKAYSITGAPRVAGDRIIIGNAGSEIGARGYVSAYDARDGHLLWRFFTVPGDPSKPFESAASEKAAKTWKGDHWWRLGGGGTVWDGMAYDPRANLLYFGTSNGTPWIAEFRSPGGGDNLFLNSIVAVHADTGKYAWHYQVTPSETWDWDATNPLVLADLPVDGKPRRVVMQASKNGFFYVLDAAQGTLLSARNFTTLSWATQVDMATGRPVPIPEARYDISGKPTIVQPGAAGAHSWHPMSFSRRTGFMYIPVVENSFIFMRDPNYEMHDFALNGGVLIVSNKLYDEQKSAAPRNATHRLVAWDPVRQLEVWRVNDLGRVGSGILSTAGGLVFQGNQKGQFVAYRDDTGEKLWASEIQTGAVAAPMSYLAGGEQYVALLAGFGTRDYHAGNLSRLLVYKLDGKAVLPPAPPAPPVQPLNPPPKFGNAATLAQGELLYTSNCAMCHEQQGANRALFPDLRYTPMLNTADAFRTIVIDGALQSKGMVSFRERISPDDTEAIRAYITSRAHEAISGNP